MCRGLSTECWLVVQIGFVAKSRLRPGPGESESALEKSDHVCARLTAIFEFRSSLAESHDHVRRSPMSPIESAKPDALSTPLTRMHCPDTWVCEVTVSPRPYKTLYSRDRSVDVGSLWSSTGLDSNSRMIRAGLQLVFLPCIYSSWSPPCLESVPNTFVVCLHLS